MYNACTIMYIHIRSQASDWNCCVKRLFVCAQQSTSLIVHKTNPSQMTTLTLREREIDGETRRVREVEREGRNEEREKLYSLKL